MYPPFLFSKISSLNWPSQCWSPSPGKYDTYLWQHYSFHCPGFIKTHKRLLMFFQMFQFRLGGKTTNISCKGHKEDASVYGVSTKQYSNSFATDGERLCRAVPYGEKDCAGLYPTGRKTVQGCTLRGAGPSFCTLIPTVLVSLISLIRSGATHSTMVTLGSLSWRCQ